MVASRRRFGVWEAHLDVSWTNKSTATLAVRFLEVQYCLYRTWLVKIAIDHCNPIIHRSWSCWPWVVPYLPSAHYIRALADTSNIIRRSELPSPPLDRSWYPRLRRKEEGNILLLMRHGWEEDYCATKLHIIVPHLQSTTVLSATVRKFKILIDWCIRMCIYKDRQTFLMGGFLLTRLI